jgi:hypothetical protein
LEHSLPWFTGVVALGVAMELWVIWRERRDGMEAWGRGIILPPERPSAEEFLVEIASVVLITAGILGELWIGLSITHINGQLRSKSAELRSKSDQLLALVTKQAGDAKSSALSAEVSAQRTGRLATQADVDARSAQQDAAQLRVDVDETELLLAAKASGHTLWPSLLKTLKSMPRANVRITWVSRADPETKEFARRLSAVLKDFNWQVSFGSSGINAVGKGVVIRNKWVSAPVHTAPSAGLDFVDVELDSSWMRQELENASKDIGHENALRLSALALALRASLEKSSDLLDQNSLFIIVGVGDSQ